jgi:hypothetical protein
MNHLKKDNDIRFVHAFNEHNQERLLEILKWCQENCSGHWYILNSYQLCIVEDRDAMLFKLIWCS